MLKRKVVELYSPARRRGFLTRPTPVERARLRSCFPGGKEGEFQPFHNVTRESRTEKEEGKINETRDESSNRTVLRVKSEESNKSNLPPLFFLPITHPRAFLFLRYNFRFRSSRTRSPLVSSKYSLFSQQRQAQRLSALVERERERDPPMSGDERVYLRGLRLCLPDPSLPLSTPASYIQTG